MVCRKHFDCPGVSFRQLRVLLAHIALFSAGLGRLEWLMVPRGGLIPPQGWWILASLIKGGHGGHCTSTLEEPGVKPVLGPLP